VLAYCEYSSETLFSIECDEIVFLLAVLLSAFKWEVFLIGLFNTSGTSFHLRVGALIQKFGNFTD